MLEINAELDHLEALYQSLEPVDERETTAGINRTKLHRFIRIHDDLEIVNERLINMNDSSKYLLSADQLRITNDLKLMFDRLNSIKRIVRIYLERLEKLLAANELHENFSSISHSPIRTSNGNLQVKTKEFFSIDRLYFGFFCLFSVFINDYLSSLFISINSDH